ncbi:TPA: acetolactate synthase small subunit [Candidatus Woesearchaeota archaeon]|nr:acetolactate synthase small subunit [Candidatus Woesearchaeota archaeon]HII68383.1 acetolactate synthase small subunit [Candidatus Woesearchaeota archaeon]
MYDTRPARNEPTKHIIALIVNDEPGVLMRITGLFLKRNFNIDNVTVGKTKRKGISRITLSFYGDNMLYEQLVKQLEKLIDVIKIIGLPDEHSLIRELCLLKLKAATVHERKKIVEAAKKLHSKVDSKTSRSIILELSGKPEKIDAFITEMRQFGIIEMARTGLTAMRRDEKSEE